MILSVNVDHVATLRQARGGMEPDPITAAALAVLGGADGITVHLREDRRHIQERDLTLLRQIVNVPLNLEMAATQEMIAIALERRPDMVTLVPEKRQELTTEGGLDVVNNTAYIAEAVKRLQGEGIPVSLFINPNRTDVDVSAEVQAMMIEVHTGLYSNAMTYEEVALELDKIKNSVARALHNGLIVNAGHGLNYQNILPIVAIKSFRGLYIGHSIISRAVMVGMQQAVGQMKELIK
ncbi:pyridoxine 5'-phosphate synthase [Candidatus Magnetobacterium bavaricum]|uniref:Pyridoxine 5'-phosphate synthase n=1 Tax=Candidatus Magnetobacterium bavaricum TaxID=29290 RepID=A0A0F3GPN3_9BACT|nr:pyridoxine 5'-phosphate synthase [Candidatus Magnetobacterium bavaricum]